MKLHKLISRAVVGTALLGATFGGALSISHTNVLADTVDQQNVTPGNEMKKDGGGSTQVNSGSLQLNSVPDLQFNSRNTSNNKLSLAKDTNLRVTDYRTAFEQGSNHGGWSLNVTSSGFNTNNSYDDDQWQINLGQQSRDKILDNSTPQNDITSNTTISNVSLNTKGSTGDTEPLVANDQGGYGITQLTYHAGNLNDANLIVPNVQPGQTYKTNMNWDLKTNATSLDN